jgi:hypothetical protein
VQANDWVGKPIAEVLKLDATDKAGKTKIKSIIKTWIDKGALVVVTGKDKNGDDRPFVGVGEWATDD